MTKSLVKALAKKPMRPKFSLVKMREVITECSDKLGKSIAKQNPEIDIDTLENDLRGLVMKHGNNAVAETTSVKEEVDASVVQANYNLAADVICLAYNNYKKGKVKASLELLAAAMESDGINELVMALNNTNSETEVAYAALAASMDEDDGEEDGMEVIDEDEIDAYDDEDEIDASDDEDGEDEDEETDNDEDGDDEETDNDEDEIDASDDEDDDMNDGDEDDDMNDDEEDADSEGTEEIISTLTNKIISRNKKLPTEQRAFLNRLSLSGRKKHRAIANNLVK